MYSHSPNAYDVIIAGAGPVGLFLACELCLANISVLVLEQNESPSAALKQLPFGMRGLSVPTVEALYRRGLLKEITPVQFDKGNIPINTAVNEQQGRPGGHFAGIQFFQEKIDTSKWTYRLPNPASEGMAVEMQHFESVLTARALSLGVIIKRGFCIESFKQSEDDVIVHASGEVFSARWLIGCDGGRSIVRKKGGFEFIGTNAEFTGYTIQAELVDPDILVSGRHYTPTGMFTYKKPDFITMVDFDGGTSYRMQQLSQEHVQTVLQKVTETNVKIKKLNIVSTWTDRAYQAATYRNGRVLLAGDAAHIHSPLGGQGLNLGLGDAMNLGWKLASIIRDKTPDDLLNSYFTERYPVGAQILDWSRAQVALMRPEPASRALEKIIRSLIDTSDGATYFAEQAWGVSLRYDLGDQHPLVGRSAPDFELTDGTTLGERLSGGKAVLLDFNGLTLLQTAVKPWNNRVSYIASKAKDQLGLSVVFVRPDGFVAWVSDSEEPDSELLVHILTQWFGQSDREKI